ncbi:MAG: Kelch repeat-containing protein [Gemmatimonadales bacterium]
MLIAGGMEGAGATAELYDPLRGSFAPAGRLASERSGGHAAVLLTSGKVLLAGGWTGRVVTRSAELYDPATGSFALAGVMSSPRAGYTATLLPTTGTVLIVGGFDGNVRLASAELYDPQTGRFAPTGSMAQPRAEHASALLPDGRVLVTGGNRARGQVLASAEIYDPANGTFELTGDMTIIRHKHAATALLNGAVLITGGSDARDGRGRYASAEVYGPRSSAFTSVSNMNAERFKVQQAVVLLRTGEALVAGGDVRAEVYDPETNTFHASEGDMSTGLSFATATLLLNGHVLIAGGYDQRIRPTAGAWVYRPRQR